MLQTFSHIFSDIIINLEAIVRHGGYSALFLISLLEGVPIIGQFIPGHTLVILSGFLAKVGVFELYSVSVVVIGGALLGDMAGFFIGRKYGFNFLKRFGKYVFVTEDHLEKAKKLVYDHVGKTIILGRFSPFTRPLTPFIVGASSISLKRFFLYDITGVILWSAASIGIGYIFGASYHAVAGFVGKFIVIAIILSILIVWGYHFINKQFHIFAKYELIVLGLNIASLYLFFKTMQDALSANSFMAELDVWLNVFISTKVNTGGMAFMNTVTNIFSPEALLIASAVFIVYLIGKKQWSYSAIVVLSMGGGFLLSIFIKELIMRMRPLNSLIAETGYSFPSNHAAAVAIFFTVIMYFFAKKIKSLIWREIFIFISVMIVFLTAFSRLYLGVHWLSDAVAGISLGLFWTTLMILFVRYIEMIYNSFLTPSSIK